MTRKKYKKLMYAYFTKDHMMHKTVTKDRIAIFYRAVRNCKNRFDTINYDCSPYAKSYEFLTGAIKL